MAKETDESTDRVPRSAWTGKELMIGSPVRVSRLDTLVHLRAEHGRLYREARRREGKHPDATTALKLSQILNGVQKTVEQEQLEKRVETIETLLKIQPGQQRAVFDADSPRAKAKLAAVNGRKVSDGTPLRKQLDKLEARLMPEAPLLTVRTAYGEDERLVIAAWLAENPGASIGEVQVTCVFGARPRDEFVTPESLLAALANIKAFVSQREAADEAGEWREIAARLGVDYDAIEASRPVAETLQ